VSAHPGVAAAATCNSALAGRTTQVAPGSGKTVALTFDDDRKEWMPAILNILRRNNIRATFFVTGQYASEMPTIMQRAAPTGTSSRTTPGTTTTRAPRTATGRCPT
jgi:peptidoglycan/xylan/chitin deacetylase (PgdA/CDA1 family)